MRVFLILATFSLLMLPGCNKPGSIVFERVTHSPVWERVGNQLVRATEVTYEKTKVTQPTNPVSPATLTHDKAGNPQASTGATDAVDQALAQLNIWVMVGLGLVVLGIAYTIARFVFPPLAVLPLWASPALILGGLAVGAYPLLLDRYGGWIFGAVAITVVFTGMYIASWVHNWLMSRVPRAMGKYLSLEEKKEVAKATGSGILDLDAESVIPPAYTKEKP